jgi:hypothetical protein
MFMPKLLISKNIQCAILLERVLVELLKFLQPFLRVPDLCDPIRRLYMGTLRVLLVLLHDFPEFLVEFHFSLCDVIPPTCVQMRNLILSAFPRQMRLPDPFTPNLKVDLLPEITQPPRILSDFTAELMRPLARAHLLAPLDSYLLNRAPPALFKQIIAALTLDSASTSAPGASASASASGAAAATPKGAAADGSDKSKAEGADGKAGGDKAGSKDGAVTYNIPLINSLVLYVGIHGLMKFKASRPTTQDTTVYSFTDNPAMDLFEVLSHIATTPSLLCSRSHLFVFVLCVCAFAVTCVWGTGSGERSGCGSALLRH